MATTDSAAEIFHARAELYAASRLPPKALALFRTRAIVTDVVAQQCWLYILTITKLRLEMLRGHDDGQTTSVPRVGILGAGHVGCAVAMVLLAHGYPPHRILISTRQPDRLPTCDAVATAADQAKFQKIPRVYDNARVSRESDVLVLCVPPSQLKSVAIQIKHALAVPNASCVVVSALGGTSIETVRKACGTSLVVRTAVDVKRLGAALVALEEAHDDGDTVEDNAFDALRALRQRAEPLAVEHLTSQSASPLARVLADLARRLDGSLSPSQLEETVAAVLVGQDHDANAIDDSVDSAAISPETKDDPSTLSSAQEEGSDSQMLADEAELSWPAAWTPSLEQLQRAVSNQTPRAQECGL